MIIVYNKKIRNYFWRKYENTDYKRLTDRGGGARLAVFPYFRAF